MKEDIEKMLEKLGPHFRGLVLHSDGRWTVRYRKVIERPVDYDGSRESKRGYWSLTTGRTPEEALRKAILWQ